MKLLVADDDRLIREIIAQFARKAGHEVIMASDGAAALATALAERPDATLLDINMPRLDGRDVISRLKRDPMTQHMPVVILTAQTDDYTRELCLEMGADDFVEKPFDGGHLISKLEYLVEKQKTRNAARSSPPREP